MFSQRIGEIYRRIIINYFSLSRPVLELKNVGNGQIFTVCTYTCFRNVLAAYEAVHTPDQNILLGVNLVYTLIHTDQNLLLGVNLVYILIHTDQNLLLGVNLVYTLIHTDQNMLLGMNLVYDTYRSEYATWCELGLYSDTYSKTTITRTPMARLPWLIRTRF